MAPPNCHPSRVHALAAAVVLALAGSACREAPRRVDDWSLAPEGDAFVVLDGHTIELHTPRGTQRVALLACFPDRNRDHRLVALTTHRALFVSFARVGGNWVEPSMVDNLTACLVDFDAGTTTGLRTEFIGDPKRFHPIAGANSGWLYVALLGGGVGVVDLSEGRATSLDIELAPWRAWTTETVMTLAESATTVTVAGLHPSSRDTHPAISVTVFDRTTWPPARQRTLSIAIDEEFDELVLSRDGRWLAYSTPSTATPGAAGLIDATTGEVVFVARPAAATLDVHDVAVVDDEPFVLATYTARGVAGQRDPSPPRLVWLDRRGHAQPRTSRRPPATTIRWLPAFRRGLAADYGTIELFTMPPPGAAP